MTDSMKFGPEWLRNLSGENSNSTGTSGSTSTLSTPRYQLAEHRYGREEMLALFDRNYKPPEPLITFSTLYVEKTQLPLALIQMTEDETRMWNGGVTNIGGRGRGGSVDRGGRSRNGRGSLYSSHYSRAVGFEDSGEVIRIDSGQSFQGRSRPFDRSQSERGWSERNGSSDPIEWNGSTSPRKELSRGTSGSSLMESNWRRHRNGGEDDDGWRKWGRNSWREGGSIDRDRLDRNEGDGEESRSGGGGGGGGGRWEFRGSHRSPHETNHIPPPRTARTWESNHHDNHDNLPEWATENPSESGGRFDASGAFHGGMYSDDDDEGIISVRNSQELRTRRVSEGNASITSKSINKSVSYGTSQGQVENRHHTNDSTGTKHREKSKSVRLPEEKNNATERDVSNSPNKVVLSTSNNTSAKSLSSTSSSTSLTMTNVNTNNTESDKTQPNNADNKCSNVIHDRGTVEPEVNKDIVVSTVNRQVSVQTESQKVTHDTVIDNVKKSEDDLDRMKEEADALVAKLMADEESHREKATTISPSMSNQQTSSNVQEKWFYRDPQGEVQGPFLASEMAEWCKAGYFTAGLMVRRTCDERYTTLGELMKICGRVPFIPGPSIPPLKLSEPVIPSIPSTVPAGITATTLPKSGIEDPLLLLQYQHMRLLQNQQILLRQMRTSAIAKLSQSEHWATLSPIEQNQLILQYVIQDSDIPDMPISTNPFVPHLTPSPSNPVIQLFNQMQQAKVQSEPHLPSSSQTNTAGQHPGQIDPIQQLIQQMGGIQNVPTISQPNLNSASSQEDNPIKSLLRQLNVNATGHPQTSHIDTVWPHSPPQITPQFNAQNWLTQVGPIPAVPPGQLPTTLWNLHTKEIKTEQQILEEQNLKLQEQRKKEELRKQEELQRQAEEEKAKRKQEEEQVRQAEEAKRKEEERKKKEEDKKRKEEEKRKQEEEQKKKEEKKRKEEEKKKREEEKRKQEEENIKRKQEEEKRKREEIKKQEEKHKKEEEKKKKLEEEQRKQEEERIKKETEARKLLEAEEQARRTEQRRREEEALRKLQERSKAPWAQAPRTPAPTTHASLADIQRLEREKKAEEQRCQQLMQQQLAQQKAVEAVQEATATDSSKRLQFKWAEKATSSNKTFQVKSLMQIQQEEQERIAKQQEKERHEKVVHKESANVLPNAGIWGTASQCLNWTNSSSSSNSQAWSNNSSTSGFWDDPTTMRSPLTTKQTTKPAATKSASNQQPQQQQNNKSIKNKVKKEEELVKKLFEQNTAKLDDFTQWCNKALSGIQASVDIPTFVGFLRDIESPYEVKEYVRVYLGDSKQSTEFAKQFLEKRSKWRSAQRPQAQVDNLCKPAPAVNPNAPTEFQEVKGKSKKPKKGKMFKVDNRILGFSVTAAPDRINVGDRDYGEDV